MASEGKLGIIRGLRPMGLANRAVGAADFSEAGLLDMSLFLTFKGI